MDVEKIDDELIIPYWFYKEYCQKCDEYKNFENRCVNDNLCMRDFCGMGWTCYACESGSNFRRSIIQVCEDDWKHDMIKSICRYCGCIRYTNYPNPVGHCNETCRKNYYKKYYSNKKCIKCFTKFYGLNTVTKCDDCCGKEKFYASSPDEKLEYYGITKLRYLAILKNIPNAEKIKTRKTLKKTFKRKSLRYRFPYKTNLICFNIFYLTEKCLFKL